MNDSITKSVSEAYTKMKAEELTAKQKKIDLNKNNKIDGEDLAKLRKEEKCKVCGMDPCECKVEEGWDDMMKAVKAKSGPQPSGGSGIKKGTRYGGSNQKDEPEVKEKPMAKTKKKPFSEMLETYKSAGLKSLLESLEEKALAEESTNDEFKAELDDTQSKSTGKKKAEVAKAKVDAVQQEEVEGVEEAKAINDLPNRGMLGTDTEGPHGVYRSSGNNLKIVSKHKTLDSALKNVDKLRKKSGKADHFYGHLSSHGPDQGKIPNHFHEEVEELDELSKDTLNSYVKKSFSDKEKDNLNTPERQKGLRKATSRLYKEDEEHIEELSTPTLASYVKKVGHEGAWTKKRTAGVNSALNKVKQNSMKSEDMDIDAINGVKMSTIGEAEMTDDEKAKREDIVKGMKKGMAGFKQRYGDRAKSVMYATATKQAMKD